MVGGSNGSKSIPREIVEEASFTQQADLINLGREELDETLKNLLFVIARLPEHFESNRGPNGEPIGVVDHTGNPRLRVWFTYNNRFVYLLGIVRRD